MKNRFESLLFSIQNQFFLVNSNDHNFIFFSITEFSSIEVFTWRILNSMDLIWIIL